jgi:prepilin-type N-terminal cleavage/methylation domain-containing protein
MTNLSRPLDVRRPGMTLVEMLIATAITLVIMGIVAQLFGMLGMAVSSSRSVMDLNSQIRSAAQTLRTDLAGITVDTLPPVAPESDSGYLEVIEGSMTDISNGAGQLTGDCDDIVMFTTRSFGEPFSGRYLLNNSNTVVRSPTAEVIWFCRRSPTASQKATGSTLYTLYRRQLLVMEYVGLNPFLSNGNAMTGSLPAAYLDYDLSLRREGSLLRPNSLGDLTKRENRFLHNLGGFVSKTTFPFDVAGQIDPTNGLNGQLTGARVGEDIVLTNVLAFDVRVFDRTAALAGGSGELGEYVDLGIAGGNLAAVGMPFPSTGSAPFTSRGVRVANGTNLGALTNATYDTWSTHYEFNGIDEDNSGVVDQRTNGIDDNLNGIVDEAAEQETSPPYPIPLRGIEVRIRCYEPSSRQVRQVSVRHTFVPH